MKKFEKAIHLSQRYWRLSSDLRTFYESMDAFLCSRRMRHVPTYYKDLKKLLPNPGHLVASTACLGGQLPKFILKYRETGDMNYIDTAKNWCQYMIGIFLVGSNFYLEMQPSNNARTGLCKQNFDEVWRRTWYPALPDQSMLA